MNRDGNEKNENSGKKDVRRSLEKISENNRDDLQEDETNNNTDFNLGEGNNTDSKIRSDTQEQETEKEKIENKKNEIKYQPKTFQRLDEDLVIQSFSEKKLAKSPLSKLGKAAMGYV